MSPAAVSICAVLATFAAALALAPVFAHAAARAGRLSRHTRRAPGEADSSRPRVGGLALAAALALAWWLLPADSPLRAPFDGAALEARLGAWLGASVHVWVPAGLAAAFLVGLCDDVLERGLAPAGKLAGQTLAGCALAAPGFAGDARAVAAALCIVALAVIAQNAINTFDNADGAASALAALALIAPAPIAAAPLCAFLVWNLPLARGARTARAPILGDAGSHLVGMLVVVVPAAWPALALPLLDLGRVALARARAGRAPWRGDRTHLAHRLLGAGLTPLATLAVLTGIALPSLLLGALGLERGKSALAVQGLVLTSVLFAIALERTARRRARRPRRRPAARETGVERV